MGRDVGPNGPILEGFIVSIAAHDGPRRSSAPSNRRHASRARSWVRRCGAANPPPPIPLEESAPSQRALTTTSSGLSASGVRPTRMQSWLRVSSPMSGNEMNWPGAAGSGA
jgi:hypothetical protein